MSIETLIDIAHEIGVWRVQLTDSRDITGIVLAADKEFNVAHSSEIEDGWADTDYISAIERHVREYLESHGLI